VKALAARVAESIEEEAKDERRRVGRPLKEISAYREEIEEE